MHIVLIIVMVIVNIVLILFKIAKMSPGDHSVVVQTFLKFVVMNSIKKLNVSILILIKTYSGFERRWPKS